MGAEVEKKVHQPLAWKVYSEQIGLRNSTQPGVVWIPAFAGMTVIKFFANHSVWSI